MLKYIQLLTLLCVICIAKSQIVFEGDVRPSNQQRPPHQRPPGRPFGQRPPGQPFGQRPPGRPSVSRPPVRPPAPIQPPIGGGGPINQPHQRQTEGCSCETSQRCPRDKGQLQHGCRLARPGKGICCINQEGVVITRFGPPNPSTVGKVALSESTQQIGLRIGSQSATQLDQENRARLSKGDFLKRNTAARSHSQVFNRLQKWRDVNRLAYLFLKGTKAIVKQENLSQDQATVSLNQNRVSPNILNQQNIPSQFCPAPERIRCGRRELKFRTVNGQCNNLRKPERGSSVTAFSRLLPPDYEDGIDEPRTKSVLRGRELPNVRTISNQVLIDINNPNQRFSLNVMQWAQFIDHDFAHAPFADMDGESIRCCDEETGNVVRNPSDQCFNIIIPPNDGFFDRLRPPQRCLNFVRSMLAFSEDGCVFGPAEQLNALTHFVDGSMVYGSTEEEREGVRKGRSASLATSNNNLPPVNSSVDCESRTGAPCFVAGDSRVSEQPGLTVMHTVLIREHNRIVNELKNYIRDPEELFEEARRIVIAIIQHITYKEWLPIILGRRLYNRYNLEPTQSGFSNTYNPNVDPRIGNAFAAAAFRFGHSLIQGTYKVILSTGRESTHNLRNLFNNPGILQTDPDLVEGYTRALTQQPIQDLENFFTQEITNHLFEVPARIGGLDLMALNLQRAREHGIPGYNAFRAKFSSNGRASDFYDLGTSHSPTNIQLLQRVYAHVDDIDLFAGGMTEQSSDGELIGDTFGNIIADQFKRLKEGDRFFYDNGNQEGSFTLPQLNAIKQGASMMRLFCDNTRITVGQPKAFELPGQRNPIVNCNDPQIPRLNLQPFYGRNQG